MIRIYVIVGLIVALLSVGYFVTQTLVDTGKQEIRIETLETNIEIRRQIDEAVRNVPTDRNDSIRVLEQFINSTD